MFLNRVTAAGVDAGTERLFIHLGKKAQNQHDASEETPEAWK